MDASNLEAELYKAGQAIGFDDAADVLDFNARKAREEGDAAQAEELEAVAAYLRLRDA